MHVVQCPSCSKQTPSQLYKFQYKDLDLKMKCCECFKATPVKAWKCNCGVLWHTCKVHSCTANVLPSVRSNTLPKSSIAKASSKRVAVVSGSLHANAPFEQILDDDLRIDAKRGKKCLKDDAPKSGVKMPYKLTATMLPPKLRERFNHLL